jgi:4-hydroxythreonine-4-phosphate dehydrogenase
LREAFFYFHTMKQIGLTIGDINGIGPEVALKAVGKYRWPDDVTFVFLGDEQVVREQASAMKLPVSRKIEFLDVGQTFQAARSGKGSLERLPLIKWHPGKVRVDASRLAERAICAAIEGCLSGELDAMVTAPICKEGFHKAGIDVPGHTEYLAKLTNTATFGMMLLGGGLRVMLVTRHLPLSKVPAALTRASIREHIELTGQAMELFGLKNGRIGVCGLNPHAGDGGVIGREEIELINPAIRAARRKGFNVSDAVPADTIFYEALRGDYDAVVAMYHDQGLGPLKMIGFDEGINVTLGLPIIRTSPDHGTAFGIAGKNKASPKSMKNALALAIDMAGRPNPWK